MERMKAPLALLVIAAMVGLVAFGMPEEARDTAFTAAGLLGLIGLGLLAKELLKTEA